MFPSFPGDKVLLQLLCFVLIDGISGCLWCLGTQLKFSRKFLILRLAAPWLAGILSGSISSAFCSVFSQSTFMATPVTTSYTRFWDVFSYLSHSFLQTETIRITYISLSCLPASACSAIWRCCLSVTCNCGSDPHKSNRCWHVHTSAVISAHRHQAPLLAIAWQWFVYQNWTML